MQKVAAVPKLRHVDCHPTIRAREIGTFKRKRREQNAVGRILQAIVLCFYADRSVLWHNRPGARIIQAE